MYIVHCTQCDHHGFVQYLIKCTWNLIYVRPNTTRTRQNSDTCVRPLVLARKFALPRMNNGMRNQITKQA